MDSLFNILDKRDYDEPEEVRNIKRYVEDKFNTAVGVMVRDKDIVINVPNAALASTLRMRVPDIKEKCKIEKRITFRIGL
jgi:hypothetical protein